ncbi:helicase associated domain-containing protein [Streptomyces sp. NPDC092307]|uniref:helicase associated domain-containing protein n=1 Tax=Streptomyces sp. NPDC092307 TaxID=3366013 RepID=UPI003820AF93
MHTFEQNLGAARAYHALHGTLAAPRGATILDIAIGQYLTNIRRPGGLGKDPDRAQRRAAALAAIDPDWNPGELGCRLSHTSTIGPPSWMCALSSRSRRSRQPMPFGSPLRPRYSRTE